MDFSLKVCLRQFIVGGTCAWSPKATELEGLRSLHRNLLLFMLWLSLFSIKEPWPQGMLSHFGSAFGKRLDLGDDLFLRRCFVIGNL